MKRKWSEIEANNWYKKQGWIRGCNFISSDCVNRLDMFQNYKHEQKLLTAKKELELCKKIGFNSVRIWANFDVYYKEKDSYMEIFEKYIQLCADNDLKVMVVLTHEEDLPRGNRFKAKKMGKQNYALGEHQGRIPLSEKQLKQEPKHYMEYKQCYDSFIEMVTAIVDKYKNDERILSWNIYNEPGITIGNRSIQILKTLFELVRSLDPIQPLCADVFRGINNENIVSEEEKVALELSDIISFHSYCPYDVLVEQIRYFKKFNRPIFLTEWLHRINHNNVYEIYPLLYLNNISNYCWGFVVGKTQTNEPWPHMWYEYEPGIITDFDFTKWQHDLFRPNYKPYDPNEIKIIEKFNALANKDIVE